VALRGRFQVGTQDRMFIRQDPATDGDVPHHRFDDGWSVVLPVESDFDLQVFRDFRELDIFSSNQSSAPVTTSPMTGMASKSGRGRSTRAEIMASTTNGRAR